jgi:type I restriction enzyme S subunit
MGWANRPLFDGPLVVVARKGTLGNPTFCPTPCWIIDTAYAVIAKAEVDTKWLYYNLLNFNLESLNEATGVPSISRDFLYRVACETPAPSEQRKIARILTALDNLIEKTESLIAKYQAIKQGMMHDLFTRGVDAHGHLRPPQPEAPDLYKQSEMGWIPKEWEVDLIENVLERIIDYRGKTPTKTDNGIPLVTAKNVRMGYIDQEPSEFIAEHSFESWMTRGIPMEGDVLFTTEAPLGNVAQITTDERLAFAQRVIILQTNNRLRNAFLKYLLMTDSPQRWIRIKGTGSTVEGIKQSVFRHLPIAFPNRIEEQTLIVMRMDSFGRKSESEEQALRKYRLHKTGLMQDLLTGKVRVKVDEAEEVAV